MQTKKQRQNTAILSLFVYNLPKKVKNENFDMSYFNDGAENEEEGTPFQAQGMKCLLSNPTPSQAPECGTSGCFCGWGPAAGIKPQKKEEWFDYAHRQFGADTNGEDGGVWETLFSGDWGGTADEAAKRGAWLVQTGTTFNSYKTPKQFNDFKPNWAFVKAVAEGKI